ncbi:hypothetical protein NOV72_03519 [Caballeronia novacaledonica]|uniref:Uncharacterized protein n=1 Tax=Caballeronia novacaledonica TaxID=1544861 RepID=A0A2U3I808_9BURK|nr:hypothetical protein [Caballeronia novacaledonica]SPB16321.1 hypothetical protein NOV72_03519 [Caballeronia novacaledonica]
MPQHAKLPEESIADRASPANDPTVTTLPEPAIDYDDPGPMRTPLRFGRLALWMASATALGIGVLGTVAYGMWFNHDQRVYAEAMASARRTLGIDQPVIAAQTQSAGAVETTLNGALPYAPNDAPAPIDTASLADNTPAAEETTVADSSDTALATASASPAAPVQSAAVQRRPTARVAVTNRSNTDQYAQARKRQAQAKPEGGLFARMGAFFHRVSYQRNVPNRQREEYSRP